MPMPTMRWPLMAEEGNPGGGGNPPPANDPPKNDPPPANDPPKNDPPANDPPPAKPVNLLDDPEGEKQNEQQGEEAKPPTDEERKSFTEALKSLDLGEGVRFDDGTLGAITPELMKMTGNDPKKAEGIVKAYTDYQVAQTRKLLEQQDEFLNGLVEQCRQRFGNDLKKVCELAKAGGRAIFGDDIWNVMKQEKAFANNPDIIEKLAAHGRTVRSDTGVTSRKETGPKEQSRDWRENMYGAKK